MHFFRKYWHLVIITIITLWLGAFTIVTSIRLRERGPVAPTVPQVAPEAAVPACTLTIALAQPSPSPTPTPIVVVDLALTCTAIAKDISSPKIGDEVTLACTSTPGVLGAADSYKFRYKIGGGQFTTLDPESASSNKSKKLKIESAGSYLAQCQACKGTTCTDWDPVSVQ